MSLPGVVLALMVVIGAGASLRYRDARLPMQWDFGGRPTWYAPRLVALWFPVAIGALLAAVAGFAAGPEEAWTMGFVTLTALAAQIVYLLLLERHRRKN